MGLVEKRDLGCLVLLFLSLTCSLCNAFSPRSTNLRTYYASPDSLLSDIRTQSEHEKFRNRRLTSLQMGMDMVTYLRTEWVSAALCTNQIPRAADTCLQLGVEDGRAVTFIPRTIRELITSSAEADGKIPVSTRRQLKQQQERRGAAKITYVDQRADDLKEMADESVDVVISITAAVKMIENGLDWKKSVREAARVLKPGGRLLFVEQTDIEGESYLDYVEYMVDFKDDSKNVVPTEGDDDVDEEDEDERFPIFDDVGWDNIDLVLSPHIAGVAIKSLEAGMTAKERAKKEADAEKERIASLSIEAYERGIKKRRKRKKKGKSKDESD